MKDPLTRRGYSPDDEDESRICNHCGKKFYPIDSKKRYCSKKCINQAKHARRINA